MDCISQGLYRCIYKCISFQFKTFYENRVAKCGTRSILWILQKLGVTHGFNVEVASFKRDFVQSKNPADIKKEINHIMKAHQNSTVRVRHFSVIEFEKWGIDWKPDWFSIVRHPVDRVSNHDQV